MYQKNVIMTQDQINYLHSTKEDWWVFLGSTLCKIMEQLRPKTGNPLGIFFLSVIINIMSS